MSIDITSIITIVCVVAVACICYSLDKHIKQYLEDKKHSDMEEVSNVAGIVSATADTFEVVLKNEFNKALEDGVITKEEAIEIVTHSLQALKKQFIRSTVDEINTDREEVTESKTND